MYLIKYPEANIHTFKYQNISKIFNFATYINDRVKSVSSFYRSVVIWWSCRNSGLLLIAAAWYCHHKQTTLPKIHFF